MRYHKVTSNKTPLSNKDAYYPDDINAKVFEHSQHFCNVVRDVLRDYKNQTGRQGVVVAPFDAELFGHWWFDPDLDDLRHFDHYDQSWANYYVFIDGGTSAIEVT